MRSINALHIGNLTLFNNLLLDILRLFNSFLLDNPIIFLEREREREREIGRIMRNI
ncbi:MAG: hypothetical protein LBT50_02725 [Prevotellaceae bacterium]|jgi:hypothetical protein|nr:hypothetical protein [Prevotellaceae bacterium]